MLRVLVFLALFPLSAFAQVVVVAPDGSGDFTTDGRKDQVQINQALDRVASDPALTTVYLKGPNTYWIDDTIFISSNTTLTGDPDAVIKLVDRARWWTKFKPMIGQKGLSLTFGLGDPSTITENITIHGFEIDGNRERQREPSGHSYYNMILLQNTRNISIHDMYLHDNLADILQTGYDLPGFRINLEYYNNRVHRSGHDGIFVANSLGISIHDNIFTDSRTDAHIRVQNCDRIRIFNNIGGNNPDRQFSGGIGVSMQSEGNTPLEDAEIYNNYFFGKGAYSGIWLWLRSPEQSVHRNVRIHDNVVSWFSLDGIRVDGFDATVIENNVIESAGAVGQGKGSGIAFVEQDSAPLPGGYTATVRNNVILNNPAYGIDNQAPDKYRVLSRGNQIYGNLLGPYHNVTSHADSFAKPALADTLEHVYYTLLHPAWSAAVAQGRYR
ncbi:MAG TPA: hypothetical protein ENK45_01765, partial [Aliiroseovarius sp.]|nr:hypothetical protein [Aliiroseovarius sp.]